MESADEMARPLIDFGVPAGILGILTIVLVVLPIDLVVGGWFYSTENEWFLKDAEPLKLIYDKGLLPALCVAGGSALVLLVGFKSEWLRRYRKVAIYLLLVMVIGPGLLVNALMKEGWGRPRPRQVENFGGDERYERLWEYDGSSYGKSFPSGHASMGFYFFCVYFLWRREGRKSVWLGLLLALGLGGILGFTRVAQGGHFVSDVVWSAGVCYFVAAGLYYSMNLHRSLGFVGGRMSRGAVVACVFAILGIGCLAIGTPYHEEKNYSSKPENLSAANRIKLKLELPRANMRISVGKGLSIAAEAEGFGSPGSRIEDKFEDLLEGKDLRFGLRQDSHGFFASVEQPMKVTVPFGRSMDADVKLDKGVVVLDLGRAELGSSVFGTGAFWDLELGEVDFTLIVPEGLDLKIELAEGIDLQADNQVDGLGWDGEKKRWKRGDLPVVKLRVKALEKGKITFLEADGGGG